MHLLSHQRVTEEFGSRKEEYLIVARTGNLDKVTITNEPYCNCYDGLVGELCTHIVYVSFLFFIPKLMMGDD